MNMQYPSAAPMPMSSAAAARVLTTGRKAEVVEAPTSAPIHCKRCEKLEEQVFALKEKLAAYEERNPYFDLPASIRMRPQANRILKLLFCNGPLAKRAIFEALYAGDPDGGPEQKIIDVLVCHMRAGLRGTGVNIRTIWGFGYEMTAYNKARLGELIATKGNEDAT